MAKEITDILFAFKQAKSQGRRTALATVVHVEGSSYRRPGARMLVEDNGKMTGAISGGCLEGDALRKALLAINQGHNKLVTYDTLNKDDVEFGVQLGCNGIVHILFEPIDDTQTNNPIELLEKYQSQRKDAVLVTLFSLQNFAGFQPGTCFFLNDQQQSSRLSNNRFAENIRKDATIALAGKSSILKQYEEDDLSAFIEFLQPAVALIVVGAGNDAIPLVEMATVLGWRVSVIDGRATHATRQRFPKANQTIVGKPAEIIDRLIIDQRTVVVLMTHNYNYDLALLPLLLQKRCSYIGTLGPKTRLQRMLVELEDQGKKITDEEMTLIFGPTGLDIGAETAEEIALSILSEIKAVLSNREGGHLRRRQDGIHARSKHDIPESTRH